MEAEGFSSLLSFPDRYKVYQAAELFPLFQNRVISPSRPEYASLLEVLSMDPSAAEPLELLALSGGKRQTDNLEVFPEVRANSSGWVNMRFFLHGWRHLPPAARSRVEQLSKGDALQVALECNNPATGYAVQVQSHDYFILGWGPRYLLSGLCSCLMTPHRPIKCQVAGKNEGKEIGQWKLLVELAAFVEPGMSMMSGEDYEPLVEDTANRPEAAFSI
jgi:hypothetical protein